MAYFVLDEVASQILRAPPQASGLCALPGGWTFVRNGCAGVAAPPLEKRSMAETKAPAQRPLSPHLQIYRPMLTMMMSIVHRMTGFGNYFGTLLLAWWLNAAASPGAYARFQWFAGSLIGRLILFVYTWSVIHHMLGGVR